MEILRVRGVLFDLDGVLIDSTPAVERVWSGWAIEHGFDPTQVIRQAHGRPSISTIRELLPNGDIDGENAEVERREIADLDGVVPLPGVLPLLTRLLSDSWAIVTSCTRDLARVRIDAAGLPLPRTIITSSDLTSGKPHPEGYLKGALSLGVPATECVVLEDAPAGIRAGKAAGAKVIALRTTMPDSELRTEHPDWIVDSCQDLSFDLEDGVLLFHRTAALLNRS